MRRAMSNIALLESILTPHTPFSISIERFGVKWHLTIVAGADDLDPWLFIQGDSEEEVVVRAHAALTSTAYSKEYGDKGDVQAEAAAKLQGLKVKETAC